MLPKPELERLDFSHTLMMKGTGDKLYYAPIDEQKIQRVLDVGTGTGICERSGLAVPSGPTHSIPRGDRDGRLVPAGGGMTPH